MIEAKWNHSYMGDCIPNFSDNMSLPRHRWYEFKEGFGSSLVERAIMEARESCNKANLTVVDPFSGSGTTPLTALQNNCNAIGFEVNPFMNFVGKTKCIINNEDRIVYLNELEWLMNQKPIEISSLLENQSSFSEKDGKEKWLFNRPVLRAFEGLKKYIMKVEHKEIFFLALVSAAMHCSNARKDGKCLRYKKNWKELNYSADTLRTAFYTNALRIIDDLETDPLLEGERKFFLGDSRINMNRLNEGCADLIVFSPPYLNSFDYSDIYRPELFLLGYVADNNELRDIRKDTLRSHVQYKWKTHDKSTSIWAQKIATEIDQKRDYLWNKDIPHVIDDYFYDMEKILAEAYRIASKNAQMWFVVSTSAYVGIEIPVDLILADIAVQQGWKLKSVNALRKLRTSSQCIDENEKKIRLRESLVICQK